MFLNRDGQGFTFFQRRAATGLAGLNNDEQVHFRAQAAMRPAAIEIRELAGEECGAIDRLDPAALAMVLHDRSLTSEAGRFTRRLAWLVPRANYTRVHGVALPIPEVGDLEAEDIVRSVAAHLTAAPP